MLARNWWAIALRGAIAILFGVIAFATPLAALGSLVLLYAAYMLLDGVFAIVAGLRAAAHHERWGLLVLEGIFDLAAAAVAFLLPGITLLVFIYILAIWAVVSGAAMTVAGFRLHLAHGRWLLVVSGLVSLVWGLLLICTPFIGAIVLTWWLGAYAVVFGAMLLGLAFRLRSRHVVVL
ncbi:MAG: HdeD family acid-resistance protein [Acidisphaera sp.]|nr:HdeD family acid-resistance protein [Acidisphaera sp.]